MLRMITFYSVILSLSKDQFRRKFQEIAENGD